MNGPNELEASPNGSRAWRAGIAIAAITSLLSVWTTIVRDDGHGMGSFMTIMAVAVGWFAAGFKAGGMARTMAGVAVMQAMAGLLIATAPIVASVPGESMKALAYHACFALLWLVAGAFFQVAAKRR